MTAGIHFIVTPASPNVAGAGGSYSTAAVGCAWRNFTCNAGVGQ
ncbi:MAG: hypothetical protein JWN15_4278, partial [Firmicutes bacterium]|nr:hypothetical protein [Bacillota bacterium]